MILYFNFSRINSELKNFSKCLLYTNQKIPWKQKYSSKMFNVSILVGLVMCFLSSNGNTEAYTGNVWGTEFINFPLLRGGNWSWLIFRGGLWYFPEDGEIIIERAPRRNLLFPWQKIPPPVDFLQGIGSILCQSNDWLGVEGGNCVSKI